MNLRPARRALTPRSPPHSLRIPSQRPRTSERQRLLTLPLNHHLRNHHHASRRVVNMVLGKSSLNLAAPFTCDITAPTSFMVIKKVIWPSFTRTG